MKTVVIGSGLAGLTAAAYLVRAGQQVSVYEQFEEIGGVTATLRREGFGWDLGPLLIEGLAPGQPAGAVLAELGVADQIRLQRSDRGIAFPDYQLWKPEVYEGPYWRRERLKALFPGEAPGLDRYYEFYEQMMDLITLAKRAEMASGPAALLLKARMFLAFQRVKAKQAWTAEQLMDHFFQRPEAKALYTAILADFVVRPSQFLGLGIPMVNSEMAYDSRIPCQVSSAGPRPAFYYVLGGVGQMVEALAGAIRAGGGSIHAGTPVRRIMVEAGQVTGVVLDDGHHELADLVLASGGSREAFFGLVGREHLPAEFITKVEKIAYMESVLMVHLGIDLDPAPYQRAALCYYYGSYDVEAGVEHCQQGRYHEGQDGFLI